MASTFARKLGVPLTIANLITDREGFETGCTLTPWVGPIAGI
jgi:hypothetical protein